MRDLLLRVVQETPFQKVTNGPELSLDLKLCERSYDGDEDVAYGPAANMLLALALFTASVVTTPGILEPSPIADHVELEREKSATLEDAPFTVIAPPAIRSSRSDYDSRLESRRGAPHLELTLA